MSSLEQIGQKLKGARESRGLTLGQIYDRTKIPQSNLEAIEMGDLGQLPEPVYIAGFIKRYADCVGLNGQSLSEEFKSHVEEDHDNGGGMFSPWSKGGKTKSVALQSAPVLSPKLNRVSIEPPRPGFLKSFFWPSVLLIIALSGISYLVIFNQQQMMDQHDPTLTALRESASKFKTSGDLGAGTPAAPTSTTDTPVAPQAEDCRVTVSASQHVWVEVKSVKTGESKFTGFLEAGDRRDFQDEQGLKVRAGNGGSLNISYKGKHETFGQAGKRTERTFMAKDAGAPGATSTGQSTAEGASTGSTGAATTSSDAPVRPRVVKAKVAKPWTPKAEKPARRNIGGDVPTRYIPGDSGGSGRSLGVPYRYTEGRLDSE